MGALEEETLTLVLNVPDKAILLRPFGWQHASDTTLSIAIQKILTAFLDATKPKVKYLYDGVNGLEGDAVVTEVSLSGGLEAMNDFSVTFQGDGITTDIGTG